MCSLHRVTTQRFLDTIPLNNVPELIGIENPEYREPPGCHVETLAHPADPIGDTIERALFTEHRFAFFFWRKWRQAAVRRDPDSSPPNLVTIDYHSDLAAPSDIEKAELEKSMSFGPVDLAKFCWEDLHPHNNGHILAAAYLNLIGDVYVLRKPMHESEGSSTSEFVDRNGCAHLISEHTDETLFESALIASEAKEVVLDVDLDFFIKNEGLMYKKETWEPHTEAEIRSFVDPSSPIFEFVFERIKGFTIATEPHYCGGLLNSLQFLFYLEDQLFNSDGSWKYTL